MIDSSNRNRFTRQGVTTIAATMSVVLLLSACSGNGSSKNTEGDTKINVTDLANEPIELVFHSNSGDSVDAFSNLYGEPLRKKFPKWTIKYFRTEKGQTLAELLAQGQRVDILFAAMPYFYGLSEDHALQYDMSDLIKKHKMDLQQFMPTLIDGVKNSGGGKMYGIPVTNMVQVLFYNKNIFNKFGVSYPKDGMTWDEALDTAKKLTRKDDDKQYLGLVASPAHIFGSNQLSVPYLDPKTGKPSFQDDVWKKLIDTYFMKPAADQAYKSKVTALKRLPYRTELTHSQDLAMFVFNSQFPFMVPDDVAKIDWDLVSMPTLLEKPKIGSQMTPYLFGITSAAQNKDAAMMAIQHLISPEVQMNYSKSGIMSVIQDNAVKAAYGQESRFKDKNWKALFYNEPAPIAPKTQYQQLIEQQFTPYIADIVRDHTDINTALREATEKVEKALAEVRK